MKLFSFFLTLLAFTFVNAQDINKAVDINTLPLNKQFDEIRRKSSTYQEYKVVKIVKYNKLKKNVIDSLNTQKLLVKKKNETIRLNINEIDNLKQELGKVNNNLNDSIKIKDQRSIFGISVEKSIFSTIIILTYLALIILLIFFAYKYQQNIATTKKAVNNLNDLENEFENHKKTSLKRFQEVSRKLQDELNKNWKKEK